MSINLIFVCIKIGLTLSQDRYAFTVDENAANDTLIGTITPIVSISLSPTPSSIAFNSSTGEIRVRPGLNYETTTELLFSIINTSDTTIGSLVIYVINVEDVPPTLSQTTYDIDICIDTPVNYTVWCIPALNNGEEDAVVTYSLTDANNLFAVDTDGIITITSSIISLTAVTLTVTLTLTDRTQSSDVTLNFNLTPEPIIPLRKFNFELSHQMN